MLEAVLALMPAQSLPCGATCRKAALVGYPSGVEPGLEPRVAAQNVSGEGLDQFVFF